MVGFVDMSLQNVDLTSNYIVNLGTGNQPVNKVFLQRLNWNFGSGKGLVLSGDRIAILNSTFSQAINYQNGDATLKTGGIGPASFGADQQSAVQEQRRQMGDRRERDERSRQRHG